jgi:hypothetical protein
VGRRRNIKKQLKIQEEEIENKKKERKKKMKVFRI